MLRYSIIRDVRGRRTEIGRVLDRRMAEAVVASVADPLDKYMSDDDTHYEIIDTAYPDDHDMRGVSAASP